MDKTIILLVVLYDSVILSLTPKEEHRLRLSENKVLRRVFVPKREEVVGGWRRLHNEELCNVYGLPHFIRVIKLRGMRWAGHVARLGEVGNEYRILVGKLERKRALEGPRHRWEDNIRMNFTETGWEIVG